MARKIKQTVLSKDEKAVKQSELRANELKLKKLEESLLIKERELNERQSRNSEVQSYIQTLENKISEMEKSNVISRRKVDILENKSKGAYSETNDHGSSVSYSNSSAFSQFKEL